MGNEPMEAIGEIRQVAARLGPVIEQSPERRQRAIEQVFEAEDEAIVGDGNPGGFGMDACQHHALGVGIRRRFFGLATLDEIEQQCKPRSLGRACRLAIPPIATALRCNYWNTAATQVSEQRCLVFQVARMAPAGAGQTEYRSPAVRLYNVEVVKSALKQPARGDGGDKEPGGGKLSDRMPGECRVGTI
jgi:hypothetical protein